MKRLLTPLLTLCMLGVFTLSLVQPALAQDSKKVVVIKKKTDENGQCTVQKVIVTDGDSADVILKGIDEKCAMIVGDVVTIDGISNGPDMKSVMVNVEEDNGEKIITITTDGETETINLAAGEDLTEADKLRLEEKGVFLNTSDNIAWVEDDAHESHFDINLEGLGEGLVKLSKGLAHLNDENFSWTFSTNEDINCAALGVYVSTHNPEGVYISRIIESSGAQEAGIMRGDLIRSIDETPTANFDQLHEALAHYRPGDVVTVTYIRDGAENRVEAQLRAWKDLPSFANSRHALVSCDKKEATEETITRKIIVIKKDRVDDTALPENINQSPVDIDNSLVLADFVAFPNPTEGRFNLQFSGESVPTVVSVFDATGKEIFRDNLDNFNGQYARELDFSGQARGAVIISVEQGGKSYIEQIVLH